jgi:hypothetical protein
MPSIARSIHLVLSVLLVAGLVVQVFLAGLGVFRSAESFATHRTARCHRRTGHLSGLPARPPGVPCEHDRQQQDEEDTGLIAATGRGVP